MSSDRLQNYVMNQLKQKTITLHISDLKHIRECFLKDRFQLTTDFFCQIWPILFCVGGISHIPSGSCRVAVLGLFLTWNRAIIVTDYSNNSVLLLSLLCTYFIVFYIEKPIQLSQPQIRERHHF